MKRTCNKNTAYTRDTQTGAPDALNTGKSQSQSKRGSHNLKTLVSPTSTNNTHRFKQDGTFTFVSTSKRRHSLATTDRLLASRATNQSTELKSILKNAVATRRSSIANIEVAGYSKQDHIPTEVTESRISHNLISGGTEHPRNFVPEDSIFDQELREKALLRKCLYRLPVEPLPPLQMIPKKVTFKNEADLIADIQS